MGPNCKALQVQADCCRAKSFSGIGVWMDRERHKIFSKSQAANLRVQGEWGKG